MFPPGQGLKSGDNFVIHAIQFLTADQLMGKGESQTRPYGLFVAQAQAFGDRQVTRVLRLSQIC